MAVMKIEAKKFKALLVHAKRAADVRSTMPILATARLEASDGVLTIETTDLSTRLALRAPVSGGLDAPVCVDLRQLLNVLDTKTKGASIELSLAWKPGPHPTICAAEAKADEPVLCRQFYGHGGTHNNGLHGALRIEWEGPSKVHQIPNDPVLHVVAGARKFMLPAMRADDFPKPRAVGIPLQRLEYRRTDITAAIDYALPATSCDPARASLSLVWFEGGRIFACDGNRAHIVYGLPSLRIRHKRHTLGAPRWAVEVLGKLLAAATGDEVPLSLYELPSPPEAAAKGLPPLVSATGGAMQWALHLADGVEATLSHPCPDETPPPISEVTPSRDRWDMRIQVAASALSDALSFASTVAPDKTAFVKLSVNGVCKVSASSEAGDVAEEVGALIEGKMETMFNARYLVDALTGIGERVEVIHNDASPNALRVDGEVAPGLPAIAIVMVAR